MATLVLAAAGSAIGGSIGGSVLGIGSAVIGKAVGATLGSVLDQRLLGSGTATVETGRLGDARIQSATEGLPIPRVAGRMRVAGQLIWSTRFMEQVATSGGGKGLASPQPRTREYSYSVSFAVALCEGPIARIGRVWADGTPLSLEGLNWRLYTGDEEQLPDAKIVAVEGAENAPAYRGTAYLVFEDMPLAAHGNRIPQLTVEVFRRPVVPEGLEDELGATSAADLVQAVALIPGTGEYALATEPVYYNEAPGRNRPANVNASASVPDLLHSLDALEAELPACQSALMVVSWFGDDLRAGECTLRPKVEQTEIDGQPLPWVVSGLSRSAAETVSRIDDRPAFGGTPSDASILQSMAEMQARGLKVVFYPFILMDVPPGNGLTDPWSGAAGQPVFPWRGRITTALAPGQSGTTDRTAAAEAEVAAFFGTAEAGDFAASAGGVTYTGPQEWSFRRFILHYAYLCAQAGGVDAFCIGSEMRSLTQIRGAGGNYPAVAEFVQLAADVRAILGPDVKIGYAADWSEYFGHHPQDGSGDVIFHLDPLWSDPAIDFVGIDNYMPLSDWREGDDHLDAAVAKSIYDLGYLRGNVAGGEGYDWFYDGAEGRDAQRRQPIIDTAHGEDWVFRYKDLANWWSRPHHDRIGGVRQETPTDWVPQSKPIWFTELGCPAVDKGTNQPNVFVDPKSSESALPYYSSGARDDYIQQRYLQAVLGYWAEPEHNPVSEIYGGPMVDLSAAHVWAWDARPWPDFPNRLDIWSDGVNHALGHWIGGRIDAVPLQALVAEICGRAGLEALALSELHGTVSGHLVSQTETARQSLQPLMLAYAFDGFERGGKLAFRTRSGLPDLTVGAEDVALSPERDERWRASRGAGVELPDQVRVRFVGSDNAYQIGAAQATLPGAAPVSAETSDLPLALSAAEGQAIADRWLAESRVAQDAIEFALPPSFLAVEPGDVVAFEAEGGARYRIDRIEEQGVRLVSAQRVDPTVYATGPYREVIVTQPQVRTVGPVLPVFLDLPLLTGDEVPHAPHIAAVAEPWPGAASVYSSASDAGYTLTGQIERSAVYGLTLEPLPRAAAGRWMNANLRVELSTGVLEGREAVDVLNGANAAALRTGAGDWEVIQFREAVLEGPRRYRLRGLLRGQAGTDGVMPAVHEVGAEFVLLDGAPIQPDFATSARGLARNYRIGPASRSFDDPTYVHRVEAFDGVGLRPYAPVHLRAHREGGDLSLSWIRRTRIDGDSWQGADVPLGEESELYQVEIMVAGTLVRTWMVSQPSALYGAAEQTADGATGAFDVAVAQISARFGAGPSTRITVNV
ncbi:MAG: glycoside hydrolase/phage tail family protein [Pseudomonadota bacterium]